MLTNLRAGNECPMLRCGFILSPNIFSTNIRISVIDIYNIEIALISDASSSSLVRVAI